jgi:hypothetical protein
MNLDTDLCLSQNKLTLIIDLNEKYKTIKLLDCNIGVGLNKYRFDGYLKKKYKSFSKMVTRGRKQIACVSYSKNFPEMLETHQTGKTTKKRQNSNTSAPPVRT